MKLPVSSVLTAAVLCAALASPAHAQEPASAAPARELAGLLSAQKLDSIATRMPGSDDEFAAALAFPGQLVVVWGRFESPAYMNERILKREFRDAYIDLNSASIVESRHFVTDLGADGLQRGERNEPGDSHDLGTRSMRFDGNWRAQKMSEADYNKAHAEGDAAYAKVLQALIAKLQAPS